MLVSSPVAELHVSAEGSLAILRDGPMEVADGYSRLAE
jgi:hypothetical protein